ncbi:uncharacterized protein C5L36_0C11670 [Pichia kudriavzevii]|uniref:GOLD domain-containing protein n=1 Tax=Pichia kudriavzevii TaxID=4909 RepID=A0A099NVL1_PICKU|nr:uncharacterized protein C5L36_0C11670 [Pichia kudriavzevii]AWU77261.1 hypothetical protein C5L36_0C11670 [Pichia kudriavzevii]KGK36004.1 hypothetical protein JL09_g4846 [Pichia kudriavzevii]
MAIRTLSFLWAIFVLAPLAHALHFYVNTDETKCFFEELPKDTIAVGKFAVYEFNDQFNDYVENNGNLKVEITVDETFDNNHRVVSQKNSPIGQFTFTSLDSGEHKFCITPRHTNWSKKAKHRVFFDLIVGDAKPLVDSKRDNDVSYLTLQTNELIKKLQQIKREQSLLRLREAAFRDISESVNSSTTKWTIIQIIVLVATGLWQLSYLKNFFVKQKVV